MEITITMDITKKFELIFLMVLALLLGACGSNHPNDSNELTKITETPAPVVTEAPSSTEKTDLQNEIRIVIEKQIPGSVDDERTERIISDENVINRIKDIFDLANIPFDDNILTLEFKNSCWIFFDDGSCVGIDLDFNQETSKTYMFFQEKKGAAMKGTYIDKNLVDKITEILE